MIKKSLTVVEMARMGGKARAAKLSAEEKSRIAKKAVAAREAKRKRNARAARRLLNGKLNPKGGTQ
jgi:hypothetical protein